MMMVVLFIFCCFLFFGFLNSKNNAISRFQFKSQTRLLGILFLLFTLVTTAQTKKQLEAKRKNLKKEITQINKLLTKTSKKEKNLVSHLGDINKKIEVRQEIINTITNESKAYSKDIKDNLTEISNIESQVKVLKADYSKMVVQSYKSKNKNSRLLFLLSSDDFLQAYKRMQYMKQYAAYRKKQTTEITIKRERLLVLNDSIILKKTAKDALVNERIKERKQIDLEKVKQQQLVNKIKKKSSKYRRQIRKKQRQEEKYNQQLADLIRGVVKSSSSKSYALTAEAKKLAKNFVSNKGKLPAPIAKGYISRYFGQRKHEAEKKIKIKSTGWFYTTAKNALSRSVFDGKVIAIMVDKKTNIKTVLIQHGTYMTTYGNLDNVLVDKGDKVKTKQNLGTVHTNNTTGKTILKFALWKNGIPQNPSKWIYR